MRRFAVGVLIALLILPLTACTITAGDYGYPHHGGYYPPPAHGHWRWDDDLRVYVSVGDPYLYYHDHTYYRWHDNHWSSGSRFNGPWRVVEHRYVPSRLGQRYYSRPRYDDHRRYDDRRDGYWDRRDDRRDRYYNPQQREWQNQRERREAEQRFQQRRDADRAGGGSRWERNVLDRYQERRWPQQRIDGRQDRQWQQPRHEGRQDRQWQQRDERRHEQRGEQRSRQERRAVSQSHSRPSESQGNRMSPSRQHDGGRQWQGQGRGER